MVGFVPESELPEAFVSEIPSEHARPLPVSLLDNELGRTTRPSLKSLLFAVFPFLGWIRAYSTAWAALDVLAGVTIGMMMVPQSLAYAALANLPPQAGLTAAVSGIAYFVFGTSKDISIGPTAVLSLGVGQALYRLDVGAEYELQIAGLLAFVSGLTYFVLGFLRLGFLLEFVPTPVVAGFTTGGAVTIIITQVPPLFGITGVDKRQATYAMVLQTCRNVGTANWRDCVYGLVSLMILMSIKHTVARLSTIKGIWVLGVARSTMVVCLGTLISFLVNQSVVAAGNPPLNSTLGKVPSGFSVVGMPSLPPGVSIGNLLTVMPTLVVLSLLEHVSVAKSLGKKSGYTPSSSQECLSLGVSNVMAALVGGYSVTGSFSRSAVQSQTGVKTPLAPIVTSVIVIMAIYFLGGVFQWIPNAVLAAVIIHGVVDLISPPSYFIHLFKLNILDGVASLVCVLVSCILTLELGIFIAVPLAMVFLCLKLIFPPLTVLVRGRFGWESSMNPVGVVSIVPALVVRLEQDLIYLNAQYVSTQISDMLRALVPRTGGEWSQYVPGRSDAVFTTRLEKCGEVRALVIDLSRVNSLDSSGSLVLYEFYASAGVRVAFVGARLSVKKTLVNAGIAAEDGDKRWFNFKMGTEAADVFFESVDEAVKCLLREEPVLVHSHSV